MVSGLDNLQLQIRIQFPFNYSFTSAIYNNTGVKTANASAILDFKASPELNLELLQQGNYTLSITFYPDVSDFQCLQKGFIFSYNFSIYTNKITNLSDCQIISDGTWNSRFEFNISVIRGIVDLPVEYVGVATIDGAAKTICLPSDKSNLKCNSCNFLGLNGSENLIITCQTRHKKYPSLGIKEQKSITLNATILTTSNSTYSNSSISCPYPNLTKVDSLIQNTNIKQIDYKENEKVKTCPTDYCANGGECSLNREKLPVCKCPATYMGNRCQYPESAKKDAQDSMKQLINSATNIINKGNQATKEELAMAVQQLSKTTSYIDLMNSSIIDDSTSVLSKISDVSSDISTEEILTIGNNILSYYNRKKMANDNSSTNQAIEAFKVVNKVSSTKAIERVKAGSDYSATYDNMVIQATSIPNTNRLVSSSMTVGSNSISSTITTKTASDNVIVLIKSITDPIFSDFSDPNTMKHSSDIVSIELYDSTGFNIKSDVSSVVFNLAITSSPQAIQEEIAKIFKSSNPTSDEKDKALEWGIKNNVQCTYLNTYTNEWLSNSCSLVSITDKLITCKCSHLTDFTMVSNITSADYYSIFPSNISEFPIVKPINREPYRYALIALIAFNTLTAALFVVFTIKGSKGRYFTKDNCKPNCEIRLAACSVILPTYNQVSHAKVLDATMQSIDAAEQIKQSKNMKLNNFILEDKEEKGSDDSKKDELDASKENKEESIHEAQPLQINPTFGNYFKRAFSTTHFMFNLSAVRTEISPRKYRALLMTSELSIYLVLSSAIGYWKNMDDLVFGSCVGFSFIPVLCSIIIIPLLAKLFALTNIQKYKLYNTENDIHTEFQQITKQVCVRHKIGTLLSLLIILGAGAYSISFTLHGSSGAVRNALLVFLFSVAIGGFVMELLGILILSIAFSLAKKSKRCARTVFSALEEYKCIRVIY
jgi:hypothetical protein